VTEPVALLLDEPFAALDGPVRSKLREDLLRIGERFSIPTLLVTHDVEEAYYLADWVVVLNRGRLEQAGPREEVFYRPRTRQVAEFFGVTNIFSGEVVEADSQKGAVKVRTPRFSVTLEWRADCPVGRRLEFCIRPEEVMIIREGQPVKDILRENILPGWIVRVMDKGALRDLFVRVGPEPLEDFQVTLPSHVVRDLELRPGKSVLLGLKKPALWIIPDS
jgi:ABC-type sulfate/molybdate transport systems ATPase subunit